MAGSLIHKMWCFAAFAAAMVVATGCSLDLTVPEPPDARPNDAAPGDAAPGDGDGSPPDTKAQPDHAIAPWSVHIRSKNGDTMPCLLGEAATGGGVECASGTAVWSTPKGLKDGELATEWSGLCTSTISTTQVVCVAGMTSTEAPKGVFASVSSKENVQAECPSGKILVGGGCRCNDYAITTSMPVPNSEAWLCKCQSLPFSSSHHAWALCVSSAVAGKLGLIRASGSGTAPCPAGKRALSGGFDASSAYSKPLKAGWSSGSGTAHVICATLP